MKFLLQVYPATAGHEGIYALLSSGCVSLIDSDLCKICVNRIEFCSKRDSVLSLPNQNLQVLLPGNISLLFLYQRARQEFEPPGSAVAWPRL